jgi:hypothetical protein
MNVSHSRRTIGFFVLLLSIGTMLLFPTERPGNILDIKNGKSLERLSVIHISPIFIVRRTNKNSICFPPDSYIQKIASDNHTGAMLVFERAIDENDLSHFSFKYWLMIVMAPSLLLTVVYRTIMKRKLSSKTISCFS